MSKYGRDINRHLSAILEALGVSENDFLLREHNRIALSPRAWVEEKIQALGYTKEQEPKKKT